MKPLGRGLAGVGLAILTVIAAHPASAQKRGGILRFVNLASPASVSILEESTRAALQPAMGVMSNLVLFSQDKPQNRLDTIEPELATKWQWSEDGKDLTFTLRQEVKWHDGKPFTSADVKCTFDLLRGTGKDRLRINPRKGWFRNVQDVTTRGDYEVTLHLKQPQPPILGLLASGWTPIYPCHVPAAKMRQHPIGTGPFKFVEFKPNQYIKVARNPDYWKKGRPYLDGVEHVILREVGPRNLAFFAKNVDGVLGVSPPTLADFKAQAPEAVCKTTAINVPRTMLINVHKPPFDNIELRRAMVLALDRQDFVKIINNGVGGFGATNMLPPPEGIWGMPRDVLPSLPGFSEDVAKNRAEARKIMQKLGYGPDKHLVTKLSTRNIPSWRDPAVLLNSHLKKIWIDTELEIVDTAQWYPKVMRRDYTVGAVPMESGVDDPDQMFYENYYTGAARNYAEYSDPAFDKLVDRQSMETNPEKRKKIVWQAERKLAEAAFRPVLFYPVSATCLQSYVRGYTVIVNSIYNNWRFDGIWLDK
jgi:peptide/nickel transport system substrate-binding protein